MTPTAITTTFLLYYGIVQIDLLMVAERMGRASRAAPPPRKDVVDEEGGRRDTAVEIVAAGEDDDQDDNGGRVGSATGEGGHEEGGVIPFYPNSELKPPTYI